MNTFDPSSYGDPVGTDYDQLYPAAYLGSAERLVGCPGYARMFRSCGAAGPSLSSGGSGSASWLPLLDDQGGRLPG